MASSGAGRGARRSRLRPVRRGRPLVAAQGYLPQIVLVQINLQRIPRPRSSACVPPFIEGRQGGTIASIAFKYLNGAVPRPPAGYGEAVGHCDRLPLGGGRGC